VRTVTARGPSLVATALVLAVVCGLAACSSPTPAAAPSPAGSPLSVAVPLDATLATGSGALSLVPMGRLNDRDNTFWQLFFRSPGATRWTLVTPPGVADNGGLVVSSGPPANPGRGVTALVGFEPSQDLVFSPLASSVDHGATWAPGVLPGALAAVPDALASSSDGWLVALERAGGGEVLESSGNPSTWSKLVGRQAIASSAGGRGCGAGDLTAVALEGARAVQVGTSCAAAGVVGIFVTSGRAWRLVGPRLSGPLATSPTKVLRLVDLDGHTGGLVAVRRRSLLGLVGLTSTVGGAWSHSAFLPLGTGSRIASTGVEPGGGFVVLVSRADRSLALDAETGPGAGWQALADPPPGTATVSVGPGNQVDALVVATTRLTDWRLDASAGTWSKISTVTVPIQFGSSS